MSNPRVLMPTTEGEPALMQRVRPHGAKGWIIKLFLSEWLGAAIAQLSRAEEEQKIWHRSPSQPRSPL